MTVQPEDNKTKQLFDTEEKTMLIAALNTYQEKIARKAAADAPKTIKELWRSELENVAQLARKVAAS